MGYVAGEKILDDEYNVFVNSSSSPFGINHIGGTGSADQGLGESDVPVVAVGGQIKASQWNALFSAMDTVAGHTGDTITSTATRTAGDPVAVRSALVTNLASLSTSVSNGCPSTSAVTTSGVKQTGTSSSTWTGVFTTTHTVVFANANKMRHFFNAGGKIRVYANRTGNGGTGGGATGKDSSWDAIYTALGNLDIGSKASTRSGSGETVTDNLARGFHDLTTSHQAIIAVADDTYPYASNNIEVTAKLNAAVGSATEMEIKMISTDGAADTTFDNPNPQGADATAYRNGTHTHLLKVTSTTTASLTNAHAESSTSSSSSTS
tara:strand:+ start:8498 stop:9460 length:963 start_codon:yes stop_codon:yes gene_type:complete